MSKRTLTLADGTEISLQTGSPVAQQMSPSPSVPSLANGVPPGYTIVPSNTEAVTEVTRQRRRLSELPDVPEKMNIVSAIVAYHMFGLADFEIAHAIGCTTEQVERIKMTDAFASMLDTVTRSTLDAQANNVRDFLADGAMLAAQTMRNELLSPNGQNRIVAAKDILDRAGHRPADIVEHRHMVEGGLTIEYVKKGGNDSMPTLDLNADVIGDD